MNRLSHRLSLVGLAGLLGLGWGGCRDEHSVVVVAVSLAGDPPVAPPLFQIRARVSHAGEQRDLSFPSVRPASAIRLPATFAIVLPTSRRGQLDLDLEGAGAGGETLASGRWQVQIVVGGRADLEAPLALVCGEEQPAWCPPGGSDAGTDAMGIVVADAGADAADAGAGTGGRSGTGGSASGSGGGGGSGGAGGGAGAAADAGTGDGPADTSMSDGGGDRIVDAAADGGRALPAEVIAWEPVSARPGAWVTAVAFARTFEYAVVGMSDGEIWLGTNGLSATPQWTRIDVVSAPAGTSAPAWPVTALAINERSPPMIWAGYSPGTTAPSLFANQQGQSSTWRYIDGPVGNVHAISRSPFETDASVLDELAVVTAENRFILRHTVGGSWGFGGGDGWIPGLGAGTLNVTALATSGGTGSGQRRYWLGTRDGSVHVSGSQTADASAISWIRVGAPFPQRQVIAISVNPARPDEIWVTFQGLASDAVWFSPDNGQTWMNRHTYALTMEPPNEPLTAMLTAVMSYSPVPFSAVTVVDSLSSFDPVDALATFVTQDRGAAWWRRIPMILR